MSIGAKIYELRTAMNLSQGDLADMLGVSRQSVSKWETDAAVPDLDKLMRLCDVFAVTLDELTCRAVKAGNTVPPAVNAVEQALPAKHQRIIGYILLAVSLLAGICIWVFAEREEELYIPVPMIVSVLSCSLICLFVKRKAGYWCAWAVAASAALLPPRFVGVSIPVATNGALVIFTVIMALVARKLFADTTVVVSGKKRRYVVWGWVGLVGLRILNYALIMQAMIDSAIAWLPYIAMDVLSYVGMSLLLTYTVCYIKSARQNNES